MTRKILLAVIAAVIAAMPSGAQPKGLRVLYIGDSITDGGWGRSGGMPTPSDKRNHTDMNHIYGHSFMMLCAAQYEADYPEDGFTFYNRGIGGNTLNDLAARWEADAIDLQPDVISILIGTNDVDVFLRKEKKGLQSAFDFRGWEETYRSLLDSLKKQNSNIRFVLCTPFVAKEGRIGKENNYEKRSKLTEQLAECTRRIAKDYNAVIVDFDVLFKHLIKNQPKNGYWIWDGIHPTPAGHAKMAELWRKNARLEEGRGR